MNLSNHFKEYSPVSEVHKPTQLIQETLRELRQANDLAVRLFLRDTKAQFRQSILGYVWLFVPPLFTALIWVFLQQNQIVRVETPVPYILYVFSGTTLWQLFNEMVNMPIRTVRQGMSIFSKLNIPKESVLITGCYTALLNFSLRFILLVIAIFIFGTPSFWGLLWGFLAVLGIGLVGFALGMVLLPLGMLYNDISQAIPLGVQVLFYLSPVAFTPFAYYPFNLISTYNPLRVMLEVPRNLLLNQPFTELWSAYFSICGAAFMVLLLMWLVFRVSMPIFVERVS